MTVDFGTDINTPGAMDLDPFFTEIEGVDALGQACARRLMTPRGSLVGDAAYGYDVRAHLNDDDPNTSAIAAAVADELAKDERVESATATVTFDGAAGSLTITATVFTAAGPFRLVLAVSAVTVELLDMEAA
jgi:hypothetical protein